MSPDSWREVFVINDPAGAFLINKSPVDDDIDDVPRGKPR